MADINDQTQNVNIWDDAKSKAVTIITDGATERLASDAKISNGSGANAVNIQDGGNSITVDGTVELGATSLAALESITIQNGSGVSAVNIQDGGNSITIDNSNLSSIDTKTPALGQATMVNSTPVVIASNQSRVPVDIIQNNIISTNNSSTANLASAGVFTGTSESTLPYDAIQVNFKASHACTLQCQQSSDNTNWDIVDNYTVQGGVGDARTFLAIAAYMRIVVTNISASTTTYLRLQTILVPVATATPRALTNNGSLKVSIQETVETAAANNGFLFSALAVQTNANQNELPLFLFRNPSANTKDAIISKVVLDVLTKGAQATFRVYLGPTITTVGTTITPVNRLYKGSQASSSMNTYQTPTISNNGTILTVFSAGKDSSSFVNEVDGSFIIGPGRDLLITAQCSANSIIVAQTFNWGEV